MLLARFAAEHDAKGWGLLLPSLAAPETTATFGSFTHPAKKCDSARSGNDHLLWLQIMDNVASEFFVGTVAIHTVFLFTPGLEDFELFFFCVDIFARFFGGFSTRRGSFSTAVGLNFANIDQVRPTFVAL